MDTIIQFVHTSSNSIAERLVEEKLSHLKEKYKWLIRADVFFKEENDSHGKGKICEIRLSCPGPRIFASSQEESHEAAVAHTIKELEVLLEKRKSEMVTH